ncbi:unnamed protein product [Parnassius apollo]|uniref:(apollo) hypothetical protein n=1 Tax=Parnassius apollo TaxID=110799 RepID=A0A8S3XQC0_PARAO|nr:unnamed protein product [Parnassius apollo]
MPPKKYNLNNARGREARRKRVESAHQSAEQFETRNADQRIRTAESCAQQHQEQRDERLRQTIMRTRAAREQNMATARVQERQRQRASRSLSRASFVRLAFVYAPDINYSAQSKIAIGTMDKYNFIEQAEEKGIVIMLEKFLEDHNELIRLIKRVSPRLQNDNYQVVIKADKVQLGEHAGRFNAPTVDEVAIIMVGDPVDKRAIKITRCDNTVSTISDLHRSYDALQYPLIFWQGQDEYHLNIKQCDPNTGKFDN